MPTHARCARAAWSALALISAPILAAPAPEATDPPARPYSGTPIDVLTYHQNRMRTGWNRDEADLTVASVKSGSFRKLRTLAVDGDVLAQPLLVSRYRMPDSTTRDVLLVVTENNSVYAFDFNTYAKLWQVTFGPPQSSEHVGCGHVHPQYGISATPVIVRDGSGRAIVYLVASTEPKPFEFHTKLHALILDDGSNAQPPVEIAASVLLNDGTTLEYSPPDQWFRAGLAYDDGGIYIAASSHCDNNAGNISGWVMRYNRRLEQTGAFSTIQTKAGYQLAAIWAAGFAPAIDTDGSVFVVTGNGNYSKGGRDWGETVLRLTPSLGRVDDFFTPASYQTLNGRDMDFGSGGVLLIPERNGQKAPPLAVAMGKDHVLYLLDRTRLGHSHPGDTGALQSQRLGQTGTGVWGGPCYWLGPSGGVVYYQASNDVVHAYAVDVGPQPSLTEMADGTSLSGFGGSLPVGSSNGSQPGTGVLWTVNRHIPQTLEAYDAERLGAPIFVGTFPQWTAGSAYLTPMQANGRVVVGTSKAVVIWGLGQ